MDRRLVALIALLSSCVYQDECAEGASRVMGRCIRGDAAGRDGGGSDAAIADAALDARVDSGARDDAGEIDGGQPDAGLPLRDVDAIAVGRAHVCARYPDDESIACIGFNDHGQLGIRRVDSARYWTPQMVDVGLDPVTMLDSSADTTCVVTASAPARIRCFGRNDYGQVSSVPGDEPTPTVRMEGVLVTSGVQHTCGVAGDGAIFCWGRNHVGQCGVTPSASERSPVMVTGALPPIAMLAAGGETTCALRGMAPSGTIYCWGGNMQGELATDPMMPVMSSAPVVIAASSSTVSMSFDHACGIRRDVEVWCWGANTDRQSDPTTGEPTAPLGEVSVGGGAVKIAVAAGRQHTCAIREGGQVWCWGSRDRGVRGVGSDAPAEPSTVPGIEADAIDIGISGLTCVLTTDHRVYCWGPNEGFMDGGLDLESPVLVPF